MPGPASTTSSRPFTIKKRSLALFFMRLPVFVPIIFMIARWVNLNPH